MWGVSKHAPSFFVAGGGRRNQPNAAMKTTRSRKAPKHSKHSPSDRAASDEIAGCCQRIETLAALLETFDRLDEGESCNPKLVGYTGLMIGTEAAHLRRQLDSFARSS